MNYRHRLTLHRRDRPALDHRADDADETKVAEVYASIEPKGGNESETADQQQSLEQVLISTRWGHSIAEIDATWWATWEDKAAGRTVRFNFRSVRNVGTRSRVVEIDAVRAA